MHGHDESPTVYIHNALFLGDVKSALKPHVNICSGHLDEAIAFGLGFRTRAALLAHQREQSPVRAQAYEHAFRERVADFGGACAQGAFTQSLVRATQWRNGRVAIGFQGDQAEALGLAVVEIARLPTDDEWAEYEACGLSWLDFAREFRTRALSPDHRTAELIAVAGAVDVCGFRVDVGSGNTWLRVLSYPPPHAG